jgi:hypothetical protein
MIRYYPQMRYCGGDIAALGIGCETLEEAKQDGEMLLSRHSFDPGDFYTIEAREQVFNSSEVKNETADQPSEKDA